MHFFGHFGLKRLHSTVFSSTRSATHYGQKLISIPAQNQAKFFQNRPSGGVLIFRDKKQTICRGSNTWLLHQSLFDIIFRKTLSLFWYLDRYRKPLKGVKPEGKTQRESWDNRRAKPDQAQFHQWQSWRCVLTEDFVSFLADAEEILVLSLDYRQGTPHCLTSTYPHIRLFLELCISAHYLFSAKSYSDHWKVQKSCSPKSSRVQEGPEHL